MATTHPFPLVEGPYTIYDLPMTSILLAAAKVLFKTSPTDSQTEQRHVEWKQHKKEEDHDLQYEQHQCMNGQKLEEVTSFKYLGATLCKDGTCSA